MGMFDTIRCECPLPGLKDPTRFMFQTKSLDCNFESYTISKDGRLILHFTLHDREGSKRDIDVCYHGMLNFYGDKYSGEIHAFNLQTGEDELHPGPAPEWFEYEAKFTDGTLVNVKRIQKVTTDATNESRSPVEHQGAEGEGSE